jgi:hypothetical protein
MMACTRNSGTRRTLIRTFALSSLLIAAVAAFVDVDISSCPLNAIAVEPGNSIQAAVDFAGGVSDTKPGNENFGIITDGNNRFDGNTYRVRGGSEPPRFVWDQEITDWSGFRGKGLEQSGRLVLSER